MTEVEPPVQRILDFLRTQVQYLGPLREDPRVVYQDSPEAQNGYVGSKGEFCAAVLQNSGNRRIHVPLPSQPLGGSSFVALSVAVNAWATFLEIGESFRASDRGRLGLELEVTQRDVSMALDLTSVGTGVSQLLPVLVLCLQAPRGSLLMIEQPELHLNPAVQQRLADFLLAVAASGRQLIVETHSEYLVSRLRLRIAQDRSDLVHKTVGFLFTERTEGRTKYRPVDTNEYGSLENWPANFFDQAAQEAQEILRAAVDKRRATRAVDGVEAAVQRLESSGASPNVRAAVEGLRALGYELKPAGTSVPGKVPENYLRILDPEGTGSVGQLWPTYFGFSRASDRERLLAVGGYALTAAVKFSHVESVQPGLNAAKLLKS